MEWYLKVVKNYTGFSGRARRKEYWMFTLFNLLFAVVIGIIEGVFDLPQFLSALYTLAVLLPSIGVGIRRLHDSGKSGWWLLISLIPFVGSIVLLVFFCLDSEPNDNKYGPNPKHTVKF
ncbi:DUF805 domain-containing protein [Neobacillus dielmonensis]|uniref:DUF805 domain-containing protein n=1 Tax=Neobacillus dielmonensis TaxID=1347369 RepID=UPI0005A9CB4E|nr:DUF805 domain-containing protein [Neobacillus dielmonensis]